MRKDVQTRIRARLKSRLDELHMTARELARSVRTDVTEDREVDAWISGVLSGRHGLHWKYFDAVAEALRLPPSELVRRDDDPLREVTPSEMRLLRHYRNWPTPIQQRWLDLLDHFSASTPDRETADLLDRIRSVPRSVRRPVLSWLVRLLEEGIPPEAATGGLDLDADEVAAVRDTTRPYATPETPLAFRGRRAGLRRRK